MPARVLVIEDNRDNLDLMVYLLRAFGHAVSSATDGEKGLALAMDERPDLIVCDLHIPRLDGFEVARRLKVDPALKRIPIVAVTALAMVGDRDKVLAAGFDGYITKPIEPEEFVRQLEAFLSGPTAAPKGGDGAPKAATAPARDLAPKDDSPPRRDKDRPVVLVVDNVGGNVDLVESLLASAGINVLRAGTVDEALALARARRPDLIVSDLHLPKKNGYDFLAAVNADPALRSIPFVVLTSSFRADEDRARCLSLGAVRFIERGEEPEAILGAILECLTPGNAAAEMSE